MPGLPEITIIGTLTADPELRFTQSGIAVVTFTVAANARKYNKDTSKWEDSDATFLRCTMWRQTAENIAECLTKGDRVIVTGTLKQREWEDKKGIKHTSYEVDAAEVGASLKWASVKVTKADRSSDTKPATDTAPDPWATTPAVTTSHGGTTGWDDEPPF